MPSIRDNVRAAALLGSLTEDDHLSIERLALLAGTSAEELRGCRDGKAPLSPELQVKLGQIVAQKVPRLARDARRLEQQASAAVRMSSGSTTRHLTAPAKWW